MLGGHWSRSTELLPRLTCDFGAGDPLMSQALLFLGPTMDPSHN